MFLIGSDGRIGNLSVVSVCAGLPLAEVAAASRPGLALAWSAALGDRTRAARSRPARRRAAAGVGRVRWKWLGHSTLSVRLPGRAAAVVEDGVDRGVEHPHIVGGSARTHSRVSADAYPGSNDAATCSRMVAGQGGVGFTDRNGKNVELCVLGSLGDGVRFGVTVDDGELGSGGRETQRRGLDFL